jgi:hypothetical protein
MTLRAVSLVFHSRSSLFNSQFFQIASENPNSKGREKIRKISVAMIKLVSVSNAIIINGLNQSAFWKN